MRPLGLLLVLIAARGLVLASGIVHPSIPFLPVFLWQDLLFVALYAVLDRCLGRRKAGWLLYGAVVAYVAVNVPVMCELATPLTRPLLGAARGTLADSILHHVTVVNLARIGVVLLAAAAGPWLARRLMRRLSRRTAAVALSTLAALALFGFAVTSRVDTLGLHRNVFVALLASAIPRLAPTDVEGDWRGSPFGSRLGEDLSHLRGKARGRNVVLIHLESTAARYLGLHGAAPDPMPTLSKLADRAVVFDHAYCVFPETIKSFVAVHSALHPALDTPSEKYAEIGLPALGNQLREQGYRTGLFHSGRFGYLGMDAVIRRRGFDVREDAGDIGGEHDSSFGIDEESTVRRMLAWIDEAPGERFLLDYLPIAGHHPYAVPSGRTPFGQEREIDRYRNALSYADSALKMLLDGLRRRGLEENTLFVVCGDHGQAFGQHPGNIGHTLFLYEENVHVPLVFALPGVMRRQERVGRVASLVDVMPTILDLLGLDAPAGREGRSLLSGPERMSLFCTDYSLGLLGLRDGRWKMIHELETGRSRLFDLEADADELDDLSDSMPARVDSYRDHLLSWAGSARHRAVGASPRRPVSGESESEVRRAGKGVSPMSARRERFDNGLPAAERPRSPGGDG